MKTNNTFKIATIACLGLVIMATASCKKNEMAPGKTGSQAVSIYLTDDPSLVFDNLFIDIQKVEVKAEDDSEARNENEHEAEHDENDRNGLGGGGWVDLNIHPGIVDLLKFRNGLDTVLGTTSFAGNRNLKKIRLTLGQNNRAVLNGISFPLVIKDKNNIVVINLDEQPVSNGGSFQLSIDIDASRSVKQHGNEFELKPEVKGFNRERSGSIEGKILPREANALAFAISDTDTSSAMPDREGEFRIVGLKDGNYTLLIHPTANGYRDSTMQVTVSGNEDTHLQPILLHQ